MSTLEQQIREVLLEPLPDEPPPYTPAGHRDLFAGWQERPSRPSREWLKSKADNHRVRCAAHGLLIACELALPCVTDPNIRS